MARCLTNLLTSEVLVSVVFMRRLVEVSRLVGRIPSLLRWVGKIPARDSSGLVVAVVEVEHFQEEDMEDRWVTEARWVMGVMEVMVRVAGEDMETREGLEARVDLEARLVAG